MKEERKNMSKTLGTMRKKLVILATLLVAVSLPWQANAGTFDFSFVGLGVSGTVELTYGTATDAKYSNAFEVTGISGTFSDSNHGLNIFNAPIGPLEPINYATPEPTNLLAPHDFSKFLVLTGTMHGDLSYDNLYWPGGSPQTASSYPPHGGFLDIYGLLFDIGGGRVVDLWSQGTGSGTGPFPYGVDVATSNASLDRVVPVSITPEPGTFVMLGSGIIGLAGILRRKINL
jgi:PEP-CTERM motif